MSGSGSMSRLRVVTVLAVLALVAVWLAWRPRSPPQPEAIVPAPAAEGVRPGAAASAPEPGRGPPAPPSPAGAAAAPAGAREQPVELPRPPPAPAGAPPRPRVTELHGTGEGPIDRRERPGPRAKQQLEILKFAFETMEEDVQACLSQWAAQEPLPVREVMIAFELDPGGLQHSWVENAGDIPFGPRSCLANVVYGLDWSGLADEPAKVTARFSIGDAGP